MSGLCVRSVCWDGERVLVGTKDSEVVEVTVSDKHNPTIITQVTRVISVRQVVESHAQCSSMKTCFGVHVIPLMTIFLK